MLYYRLFSYLIVLLLAFLLSLLFWKETLIYGILVSSCLLAFWGIWFLVDRKVETKKEKFFYSFFGFLIIFSAIFLFIFIENIFLKIVLAVTAISLFFYYIDQLFTQYFKKMVVGLEKLWVFFRLSQIFIIFLLASSFFGLTAFLYTPVFWLALILPVLILVLGWYNNYGSWDVKIKAFYFKLIIALLIGELFVVISFLPLIYYLKGMLLVIFYFFINESINWHFSKERQAKQLATYLLISIILILLILGTATWF
ncbi:hypothetical protein KKF32_01485 [Patescibacteria group bacterium]|nr:hypothetical protein [Patescibacteria group bacterium]